MPKFTSDVNTASPDIAADTSSATEKKEPKIDVEPKVDVEPKAAAEPKAAIDNEFKVPLKFNVPDNIQVNAAEEAVKVGGATESKAEDVIEIKEEPTKVNVAEKAPEVK